MRRTDRFNYCGKHDLEYENSNEHSSINISAKLKRIPFASAYKFAIFKRMRKRKQKQISNHYCLLVNKKASRYSEEPIKKLTAEIRKKGDYYTVFDPDSPVKLLHTAQKVAGLRRWHNQIPPAIQKRGPVTALIACGGDGTVNLVGKVGIRANLPTGILPMGKLNNIALSVLGDISVNNAIKIIISGRYQKIDYGQIGKLIFFGSVGFNFSIYMQQMLNENSPSRFAFRWGQIAQKAVNAVKPNPLIIKIDSFRFEVTPTILNINLLPYSLGLPFSKISIPDDGIAELIFNYEKDSKTTSQFIKKLYKNRYIYGSDIKQFRGKQINIHPVNEQKMYLDGELTEMKYDILDLEIISRKFKIFS